MVNNHGFVIHKIYHKKRKNRHDYYNIYKKNHLFVTPKEVVNVVDLVYLGVEKDHHAEQLLLSIPNRKKRNLLNISVAEELRNITKTMLKEENSDIEAYHHHHLLQIEKIQQ